VKQEAGQRLFVGGETSERQHRYRSPDASAPYGISSRYEWGPDTGAKDRQGHRVHPAGGHDARVVFGVVVA
jgi:hypothetical protein